MKLEEVKNNCYKGFITNPISIERILKKMIKINLADMYNESFKRKNSIIDYLIRDICYYRNDENNYEQCSFSEFLSIVKEFQDKMDDEKDDELYVHYLNIMYHLSMLPESFALNKRKGAI